MHKVKSINILEYRSNIPQSTVTNLLQASQYDNSGKYEIILSPKKTIVQKGPYIHPPVRWIESFEDTAEFHIQCEII